MASSVEKPRHLRGIGSLPPEERKRIGAMGGRPKGKRGPKPKQPAFEAYLRSRSGEDGWTPPLTPEEIGLNCNCTSRLIADMARDLVNAGQMLVEGKPNRRKYRLLISTNTPELQAGEEAGQ